MAARVPARLSAAAAGRRFGLTVGAAFAAVALVAFVRGHAGAARVPLALAAALAAAALLVPARLGPVERLWMRGAHALSRVTTPVTMGVLYYLVLTPAGFLRRTFGTSPIARRRGASSYWVPRDPSARRSDLRRQF